MDTRIRFPSIVGRKNHFASQSMTLKANSADSTRKDTQSSVEGFCNDHRSKGTVLSAADGDSNIFKESAEQDDVQVLIVRKFGCLPVRSTNLSPRWISQR